ncbi:hypothetical protein AOLI_G00217110 [Acnodon oligacanthus]
MERDWQLLPSVTTVSLLHQAPESHLIDRIKGRTSYLDIPSQCSSQKPLHSNVDLRRIHVHNGVKLLLYRNNTANEQEVHEERRRKTAASQQENPEVQEGREDTPVFSSEQCLTWPHHLMGVRILTHSQMLKLGRVGFVKEKKQRVTQDPGRSSLDEVSFLSIELKASTPKAPQEHGSMGPRAGETCFPPLPRRVKIKEEQVSQEIT